MQDIVTVVKEWLRKAVVAHKRPLVRGKYLQGLHGQPSVFTEGDQTLAVRRASDCSRFSTYVCLRVLLIVQ